MNTKYNLKHKALSKTLFLLIIMLAFTGCGGGRTSVKRDWISEKSTSSSADEQSASDLVAEKEKKKESEDLRILDNMASALATVVANAGGKADSGTITVGADGRVTADGSGGQSVRDGMIESLGSLEDCKLSSGVGSGQPIICDWDASKNYLAVYVARHDSVGGDEVRTEDGVAVQNCKYSDASLMVEK